MRIFVCVKHVPDTQSNRRIIDGQIVRGEEDTINDLDENALEAALQLRDQLIKAGEQVEIVAITMGPANAKEAVQQALQMGADRGLHIEDPDLSGSDVFTTAQVLRQAIEKDQAEFGQVDLILAGAASLDGMTSMLPAAIAANLQWPCLAGAGELELTAQQAQITVYNGGEELVLATSYPAVVSVTDEVNRPRHPGFKEMLAAKKKTITKWNLADLGIDSQSVGKSGASAWVYAADEKEQLLDHGQIITDTGDGGKQLVDFLSEQGYLN